MRRSRDVILAEAARWHIDQQGGLTGDQDEALSRWLTADPQHAVAFAEVSRTWDLTGALAGEAPLIATEVAARSIHPMRWLAAAAVAAFLAGGIGYLTMQPQHYATAVGEIRSVSLADGSNVTLNTASELEVSFTRNRRNVRLLHGEAIFQVAKDHTRPFVVMANGASMQAVGTVFDVRDDHGAVELTVSQGIVTFQPSRTAIPGYRISLVKAGYGARTSAGSAATFRVSSDDLEQRTLWQTGMLKFSGKPLEQVVDELNRYRASQIVVADDRIAAIPIGGRFPIRAGDEFLAGIEASFNIRAVKGEDGKVYLFSAEERRPAATPAG
jgi:transmembrane sensor